MCVKIYICENVFYAEVVNTYPPRRGGGVRPAQYFVLEIALIVLLMAFSESEGLQRYCQSRKNQTLVKWY